MQNYKTKKRFGQHFLNDFSVIDEANYCYVDQDYSKAYLKHLFSVNEMLGKQNDKLHKAVEGEIHTIEISDRKTYYENEQNGYAGGWSSFLETSYKYVIIALIIIIILKKRYRELKLWGIIIGLVLYPTMAYYFIELLKNIYYSIVSKTNWVYLHL